MSYEKEIATLIGFAIGLFIGGLIGVAFFLKPIVKLVDWIADKLWK